MFYGDYRHGEDPLAFLTYLETTLANLPHLSEPEKCKHFYLRCKSDSDAEDWYENLERTSPTVVASWPTLVLHFRVKWLKASPDLLLETDSITTTPFDAATSIVSETNIANTTTTTTTIPAPTSTAALAVYKTTTTPERVDRVAEAHHVITSPMLIPAQLEAEMTDASTDPSLSDIRATYTAVRQHGRAEEELEVERVEKLEVEAPGTGRERIEASTLDINEQEKMQSEVRAPAPSLTAHLVFDPMLHEPARFNWAAEVNEALGLSPVALSDCAAPVPANLALGDVPIDPFRTTCKGVARVDSIPSNPTTSTPINPAPGDPAIDPDRTAHTGTVPANSIPVPTSPVPTDPIPVNPVPRDATVDPVCTVSANAVPTDPVPVDPPPPPSIQSQTTSLSTLITQHADTLAVSILMEYNTNIYQTA
jgi:hypothetical protein